MGVRSHLAATLWAAITIAFSCAITHAQSANLTPPVPPASADPDALFPQSQNAGQTSPKSQPAQTKADDKKNKCDAKKCKELAAKAASSHKGVYYANDFSYLKDPCYCGNLLGDKFKGLHPTCYTALDVGGQYRIRFHNEWNMRGLGLTGLDDTFLLHRTRLYGNLKYGDDVRLYAEYIDAVSNYENFNPRPIEENRSDLLNVFADLKLLENGAGELSGRVGRQELLYGQQRLISPLDWANTRRTFNGAKLFWKGEDWDVDAFWTRPVLPDAKNFDRQDESQEFMGLYSAYKGRKNETINLYYLRYAEYDNRPAINRPAFDYHTLGALWHGSRNCWLWDVEGGVQWGDTAGANHLAGFFTLGLGRKLNHCWDPKFWVFYDWASGDDIRNNGFDHLFPLAHKYLGFMDLYGRRNIEDLNFLLTASPHKKLDLLLWFHIFQLQNGNDVPYNVVMGPSAAVPGGSQHLGNELDMLVTLKLHPRSQLLLGYSYFWAGKFYSTNPSPGLFNGDASFFYTQWNVDF